MKTAAEILVWCVENNDVNDFAIITGYSGHVSALSVHVCIGGYKGDNVKSLGHAYTTNQDSLDELFTRIETLKYYNDQSSQWANELAENNKQRKIADLKLKLSELEG